MQTTLLRSAVSARKNGWRSARCFVSDGELGNEVCFWQGLEGVGSGELC